ncbi:MAG: hypothetical protein IKK75_00735 [Clostridia bacterium]|nr:hypothetical protein [Clostridia bacterium]
MGRCCRRGRCRLGSGVRRGWECVRLAGVVLLTAGLVLMFLCIPGWAWAALLGAALTALGLWLATLGIW